MFDRLSHLGRALALLIQAYDPSLSKGWHAEHPRGGRMPRKARGLKAHGDLGPRLRAYDRKDPGTVVGMSLAGSLSRERPVLAPDLLKAVRLHHVEQDRVRRQERADRKHVVADKMRRRRFLAFLEARLNQSKAA